MSDTDLELLARYTRQHAEDAFAELVRRHLGLVYSAALRQVRSPQLAEELAQSVFIDLARSAAKLKPDTILTAWLYQVTRRTAIDVVRREASRQLREQIATEMNAMNATAADWTHIEPLLDEAMHALDDTDRAAVLLRYFENKSLREVGATLGTSENAAQKRLGRAVERLREFFAKRGVTVGGSGLVLLISTNAVLVAPAGLSAAITAGALAAATTAALTGATVGTLSWLNAKSGAAIVAAALIVGLTVYLLDGHRLAEHDEAARVAIAQQQQMALARDEALAVARVSHQQVEALRRDLSELPQLRSEIARLRNRIGLALQNEQAINTEPKQPALSGAELRAVLSKIDLVPHDVMGMRTRQIRMMWNDTNAVATVRAQGTNLLPPLLELLGTEDKDVPEILGTDDTFPDDGPVRRLLAVKGFYALGSNATPAIPALLKTGMQGLDDDAAYALAGIGPAAAPLLVEALSSPDEAVRRRAMVAIALIGPAASAGSDVLIRCLGNPQEIPDLRLAALFALEKTDRDSEQALPVLLEAFRDSKLLGTTSRIVFTTSNAVELFSASFEHYGPRAKAAFPGLLELLPKVKDSEIWFVQKALKAIDAQAAAEAGIQ